MSRMTNPTGCILYARMWDLYFTVEERDGLMMRKVRNQKWIYLLLVITVMISGICLEKIQADAYFSCNHTRTIVKLDGILRDVPACRTETLSQREVLSSLRTAKRETRHNQIKTGFQTGFCVSYAEILPQNIQLNQAAGIDRSDCEGSSSAVILSYIHKQDGEKA